ncbi:response regulator transcription factor [Geminicoccus roseus]|uniref:response regulator transcription factor n=1 Tax=Geminicoccus roseus TaxID=404900 RepID=UPI0004082DCB
MAADPVIAIIDDDASVRAAMGGLIRSLGFDCRLFASAEEFLATARPEDMDCLVMDVQMPGMSGLELQRHLQARHVTVPVVIITAYPEPQIREQALRAGAIGFLAKPFPAEAMIDCLEQALRRQDPDPSA